MDFADSFFDKDQFANFHGGNEFEADYPFFDKFPFQSEESSVPQEDIQVQQNKDQPNLSTFTIPEIPIPSQAGTYGIQITSASIESHSAPLQVVSAPQLSSSFEKQEQDLCSSTSSLRITPLPELPLTNLSIESSSNRSTTSIVRRNSLDQSNDSTSIPLLCNNQSPLSSPRGEPTSPRGIDSTVTTKEKKNEAKKDKKDKSKDKSKGEKKEKQNLKLQRGSKNRLKWTPELITLFQNAVKKLGAGAVPSAILEEMNVKGLSRENVASHLQKYRLQNKKVPPKDNTDDILYPEEKEQLKTMTSLDLHEKYMDYHRRYTMPPPPNMMPPHMGHPHHPAPPPYYCYNCTRRYSLPGCSLDQTPPPHPPAYHVNKYEM